MRELDEILQEAVDRHASDIHITAGRPVIFRIDGDLRPLDSDKLTPEQIEELVVPLFADNDRLVETMEKTGEIDFAHSLYGRGRFRVNVFKQRGTLAMVMRLLPFKIPAPRELGLPASVQELCQRKRGLVLVTGATGSGKSTTLASLINMINKTYSKHIITMEDPIEYLHRHEKSIVNQREIGDDTESYAGALRAALREDPDVILVGEMRDLETIQTAITAAETGHLVFSTLHTNNAADTINRVIDVFPPHQQQQIRVQLASVIECVISQQLLPIQTGSGRVAAFEVMMGTSAVRNLIREGKAFQIPSMIQTSKKQGMQSMDDALYNLYIGGLISAENCLNYAQDAIAMSRKVTF
ncbi:MAG: type IV pilus twitching motility protein PilT [Lachnospiraceae bacterium]|mgnify:FL=1|jgi:pilus retraction protein PilT|nr:type IV pilus twitching motility protein PilT [Lachnospiraceae bacterium]MBR7019941.1 type IV pilus twitching motility protein PilT [Lachnospiraceae bacterium]